MALTMTHDEYEALHPDYRRIVRGRKQALSFDTQGRARWTPVRIVRREAS